MAKKVVGENHFSVTKSASKHVAQEQKHETSMPLFVLKTVGFTIVGIVFAFYYFMAIFMGVAPSVPSRVFDAIGSEKSALVAYEQQYKHYPSPASLYNVIAKSVEIDDKARMVFYIPKLRKMEGYKDFEQKIKKTEIERLVLVQICGSGKPRVP